VQPRILERHFNDLQNKYGAVVAVDLVNTVSTGLLELFRCCSIFFSNTQESCVSLYSREEKKACLQYQLVPGPYMS
jgi:hypothetical protein